MPATAQEAMALTVVAADGATGVLLVPEAMATMLYAQAGWTEASRATMAAMKAVARVVMWNTLAPAEISRLHAVRSMCSVSSAPTIPLAMI